MAQKHPTIWPVVFLLLSVRAGAQTDSIVALLPFTVSAPTLRTALPGEHSTYFDTAALHAVQHSSLADILSARTGIYVKSYGSGSLATTAIRGGSASHTSILWNGLPIQSPMNGLTDLSLLPLATTDAVAVHYSGSGAQWGSGAIGGAIDLINKPANGNGGIFRTHLGSFGQYAVSAKVFFQKKQVSGTTRIFASSARNNFPYTPAPGLPEKQQSNAHARQTGVLQDVFWAIHPNHALRALLWIQNNTRQIAPTLTQNTSLAHQDDAAVRLAAQWIFSKKKHKIQTKAAFFQEKIAFTDQTTALSNFKTGILESEHQWIFSNRWQWQNGFQQIHYHAVADGYKNGEQENRFALFSNLRFSGKYITAQATARQEWQGENPTPFIPGIGANIRLSARCEFQLKTSRHYRLPTLNDRYWQPGGNPALRPESGWGSEAGMVLKPWKILEYRATGFHRKIQDWIQWSIADGQSYWSANNITEVWSRGIEQRLTALYAQGAWRWRAAGGYDRVRSTYLRALVKPNIPAGTQLIYTPLHRAFGQMETTLHHYTLEWSWQYTSAVSGINMSVPGYHLHHFRAGYTLQMAKTQANITFHIQNIFNHTYQVIERRPMPGRNFMTSISFQLL